MAAGQEQPASAPETADGFGRREQCFVDHQRTPFSFEPCVPYVRSTMVKAGENKLLNQLTLQDLVPYQPILLDEEPDFRDEIFTACLELPQDPSERTPPLFQGLEIFKKLLVSTEPLALGSDPESDLRRYQRIVSNKRFGRPLSTWLPLVGISRETDGESPSSPRCRRLQSLLQRELENEAPVLSDEASAILERVLHLDRSLPAEVQEYLDSLTNSKTTAFTYPEPMTPPILASSDKESPFIPLDDSNIIDLTSPPTSPRDERQALPDVLEDEQLFSEPGASIPFLLLSPSQKLPDILQSARPRIQDLETDIPVPASPDSINGENPFEDPLSLLTYSHESPTPPDDQRGFFDDAFSSIIEQRASYVQKLAEQEHLDSLASSLRAPVPVLDFDTPQPQWQARRMDAESQFRHLHKDLRSQFAIEPVPRDFASGSSLRWNPVPPGHTCTSLKEVLPSNDEAAENLLEESAPALSSASFFVPNQDMDILKEVDEMELETNDPASSSDNGEARVQSPAACSIRDQDQTSRDQSGSRPAQTWSKLLGSVPTELLDIRTNLLPRPSDTSATSSLVSSFMQLRGKKPISFITCSDSRMTTNTKSSPWKPSANIITEDHLQETPPEDPAQAPEFQIPGETAPCVISLETSRSLISHLEALWPPDKLIDMDFSRSSFMPETGRNLQPSSTTSNLSIEADVALSPSVGIIVTTLLKVRQRALPGSKDLAPLRERIKRVSEKYETIFVLVSERNPSGEHTSPLSPPDAAAYADLVRFAAALHANSSIIFVPGAEATLAKWIVSLMCRFSRQSVPLSRFITARETPWELFLRQAGFNVIAAKVLAGSLLEDAGPTGLARYIVTPVQERIAAFAGILGGEKVIRSSSAVMDRGW